MKRLIKILGLLICFSLGTFAQSQDIRGKRVIVDQSLFLKHWVDSILNDTTNLGPKTLLTAKAISDLVNGRVANAGLSGGNLGSGWRWYDPDQQALRTYVPGYALIFDTATAGELRAAVDTSLMATRAWMQKDIDSLAALISAGFNLGNSDLTQTAATRVYNVDAQALYWDSIGSMRWYNEDGTQRLAELSGSAREGFWGDPGGSGPAFHFTSDSLFLPQVDRVTDTTGHDVIARTPGGGLVRIRAGAIGAQNRFGVEDNLFSTNRTVSASGYTFKMDSVDVIFNMRYASNDTFRINRGDKEAFWVTQRTTGNTVQAYLAGLTFTEGSSRHAINSPSNIDGIDIRADKTGTGGSTIRLWNGNATGIALTSYASGSAAPIIYFLDGAGTARSAIAMQSEVSAQFGINWYTSRSGVQYQSMRLRPSGELQLNELQASATADSVLVVEDDGIVRRLAIADLPGGGGGGGVTTVGTFNATSYTNGANISGTTITFGPADATNPGMVSTSAQTWAGIKTLSSGLIVTSGGASIIGTTYLQNGFQTNATLSNSNLMVHGNGSMNVTTSELLLAAGTGTTFRAAMRGNATASLVANYSYSNFVIGTEVVTKAASGNHNIITGLSVKPVTINTGSATITNTATIHVQGPSSATVSGHNYSIFAETGDIGVLGSEGNTFYWGESASEIPANSGWATPTSYYGQSLDYVLGEPDGFLRVTVAGTAVLIPYYLPFTP